MRAPPDHALELVCVTAAINAAEKTLGDERAAAPAGAVIAAENIGVFPGAAHPGADAQRLVAVFPHEMPSDGEDLFDIGVRHGGGGVDAGEKADFSAIFITHPGQIFLIQKRGADGAGGAGKDIGERERVAFFRPLRVEHIGAEFFDGQWVVAGGENTQETEGEAHDLDGVWVCGGALELDNDAGGVARFAPAIAGAVDGPGAFHFEVGVHAEPGKVHEEVLAIGPDAIQGAAIEAGGGKARDADGAVEHFAADEWLESAGELVDGIAFGHGV